MDYKKIFILLLVLANIFLVIGLLVNKEIIVSKENFQLAVAASNTPAAERPNPYNFPSGRCLSQDLAAPTPDPSDETDASSLCKFHIYFIVNNPEGCQNDADTLAYYEEYFGESSSDDGTRQTYFTIPDLHFGIYRLEIIDTILRSGLDVSNEILALQARQASPFIIYKNKNSHTYLLHRASDKSLRLEVGSGLGKLMLKSGGNVTSIDQAKNFCSKIMNLYLPEAPNTCPPNPK